MYELNVELCDVLTPKSCSKLLIQLIKYILYNAEQIPVSYDCLNRLNSKSLADSAQVDLEGSSFTTYKEMKANAYCKTVDALLRSCENLFSCLETEFSEPKAIRELVIMVGSTVVLPKKVFRITVPTLPSGDCCNGHSTSRNLQTLVQHVVSSDAIHDYLKDRVGPANIFVFLKMKSNIKPKTSWFLPNENFRFSKTGKLMKINLTQPVSSDCSCLQTFISDNSGVIEPECQDSSIYTWYQSKDCLKGLKNGSDKGVSFTTLFNCKR